jgi:hypothetical protein
MGMNQYRFQVSSIGGGVITVQFSKELAASIAFWTLFWELKAGLARETSRKLQVETFWFLPQWSHRIGNN